MPADHEPKPTPLAALHAELGAEMVEHAGFQLAYSYADVVSEHRCAREAAALFYVTHMGQAILRGDDLAATVESLAPVDLRDAERGRSFYTVLTNDDGGIIVGKLDPLCYLHGEYWSCGTKLGHHGYTRK